MTTCMFTFLCCLLLVLWVFSGLFFAYHFISLHSELENMNNTLWSIDNKMDVLRETIEKKELTKASKKIES